MAPKITPKITRPKIGEIASGPKASEIKGGKKPAVVSNDQYVIARAGGKDATASRKVGAMWEVGPHNLEAVADIICRQAEAGSFEYLVHCVREAKESVAHA